MQTGAMQDPKGWDTRAWLVGILGGAIGGSVMAWATYPPLARRINVATHSPNAADWISGAMGIITVLVLPGLVSGIARRRIFLWGLVPLTLFLLTVEAEDWIENGWKNVAKDWWLSLLAIGCCLLVSSGPVSLFRYRQVRARRRREAAFASLVAQREAASIPQEGVWPPPPDYRK